jgi:hypothetical protein
MVFGNNRSSLDDNINIHPHKYRGTIKRIDFDYGRFYWLSFVSAFWHVMPWGLVNRDTLEVAVASLVEVTMFNPENGVSYSLRNVGRVYGPTKLHGITSRKTLISIFNAERT